MAYNHHLPKKVDLTPRRHHGYNVILFIFGMLLPPLAVAARFGIGRDFFINVLMTICGYFPGHGHNFYLQNIRNNANKARTPKWAIRYGLVNSDDLDRRAAKSQWTKRYDERLPESSHMGQDLADGEVGDNYVPYGEEDEERARRNRNEGLWTRDDEEFYQEDVDVAPNQQKWHYPANFEGAVTGGGKKKKHRFGGGGGGGGGDRFEREREAGSSGNSYGTYPPTASTDDDVPEWGRDYGGKRRSSRNKSRNSVSSYDSGSTGQRQPAAKKPDDVFNHEF